MLNYSEMTYQQMADIVKNIAKEVGMRNKDDDALYYLYNASTSLRLREDKDA